MHKLLIKFTDQSPGYAAGVEFGRLLQKMQQGAEIINNEGFPVRIDNCDTLLAACNQYEYSAHFGIEYFGEWVQFTATKNYKSN